MPVLTTDYGRVFLQSGGPSPTNVAEYQGQANADGLSWKQGDIKPIRDPSPLQRGQFITIGKLKGDPALPEVKMAWRYTYQLSELLQLIQDGCPANLYISLGVCGNPQDFEGGWQKMDVLENAEPTDYTVDKLTALDPSERAAPMESAPFTGDNWYEIVPMVYGEQAKAQVVQEVIDITVVDSVTCGNCGLPSDGCQVIFAVTLSHGGSPGLPGKVIWTNNGGATWTATTIGSSALPANDNPSGIVGVGDNIVVISQEGERLVYAPLVDIIAGTATWTSMTTGFVSGGGPTAVFSLGPNLTWMVGAGGYIYFTADPTTSVTVQDAGNASATAYTDIHGMVDGQNLLAVGASNAVVYTVNGGALWSAVTGPNPGIALNTCFMFSQNVWWVGDAAGKLWYTENAGLSWTQKTLPTQSALTNIRDIVFGIYGQFQSVGYLAAGTATVGKIFRTINGGNTWSVEPMTNYGSMPSCLRYDRIATCGSNPNNMYACGVATAGVDGIIIKGQG